MGMDLYKEEFSISTDNEQNTKDLLIGININQMKKNQFIEDYGIKNIKEIKETLFEPKTLLSKWFPKNNYRKFSSEFMWDFSNREKGFHFLLEYNEETQKQYLKEDENFSLEYEDGIIYKIIQFAESFSEKKFNTIIETKYGNLLFLKPEDMEIETYTYILANNKKEIGYMRKPFRHTITKEERNKQPANVIDIGNFRGVDFDEIIKVMNKAIYYEYYCFITYSDREVMDELSLFVPEENREYFLSMKPENKYQYVSIDW